MDEERRGRFVICPTPLGNLEDVTLRVLRALRESDVIFAEDTRVSETLLRRYEIRTPTRSYHESVEGRRRKEFIDLLADDKTVALITDAGMPGISDPGVDLVRAARDAGAAIDVLPGPSALVGAVVLSGFDTANFRFEGFPPRKPGARRKLLEALRQEAAASVWYEAPTRVRALLEDIEAVLPERDVFVLREYTKKFEEHLHGTAAVVLKTLGDPPRGEFVVVIDGCGKAQAVAPSTQGDVEGALRLLMDDGVRTRTAVDAIVAATGLQKNAVYDVAQRLKLDSD
jgi:16S rRNA (cytidine1402-2'-O)-methyltransferase